jgi:hypothetical protein
MPAKQLHGFHSLTSPNVAALRFKPFKTFKPFTRAWPKPVAALKSSATDPVDVPSLTRLTAHTFFDAV